MTAPRPLSALVLLAAIAALAAAAPSAPAAPQSPSAIPYYPELLEKLKSPSSISRRQAALDLAKMGADARAAVPDLQKALLDTEPPVRSAAAFALGEIGIAAEPASTTLLRSVTSDKDANVRKDCAAAIAKIGPKALKTIPGLISLLRQESDAEVREAIAAAIVRVGPNAKETITGLVEKTADPSPAVREIALRALGRIGPAARAALPAVEKAAADSDAKVSDAAKTAQLRINGEIEDPVEEIESQQKLEPPPEWKGFTIADLMTLLKSPTPSTRLKAIRAVDGRRAQLGADAKAATAAITAILKDDPETAVRASAATTLGSLGMESPELTRALTDPDPLVRVAAARAIGTLGAKGRGSARALTLARVRDVASPVRRSAGEALRTIERDLDAASKGAADPQLKKNAEANQRKLVDDVVKALTESFAGDEDIRARATMCAAELGPAAKDTIPQLLGLLKDQLVYVRAGAAAALGEMGDDAKGPAVPPLEGLLKDPDPRVRKRAGESLARLDKRFAPQPAPKPEAAKPNDPKPNDPKPNDPQPKEPRPQDPKPNEPQPADPKPAAPRPPAGTLAAQVADLLDGEGGITDPSSRVEGTNVTLVLQLAHDRFDEDMSHGDGVRLALKILIQIPTIQELSIETVAHNGRPLRKYRVTRAKAAPFFDKLDDPFERRRARDWWDQFAERVK